MSEYTLSNSAAVIDAAISSVAGADAAPTAGSQNMVTSGGVKTYVDGAVGDLVSKTVTTEATGIGNTDNDTSIPTSAAVKDYVDNNIIVMSGLGTLANGASGTATSDMFIMVQGGMSNVEDPVYAGLTINGTLFRNENYSSTSQNTWACVSGWVKKGETYRVEFSADTPAIGFARYRNFNFTP